MLGYKAIHKVRKRVDLFILKEKATLIGITYSIFFLSVLTISLKLDKHMHMMALKSRVKMWIRTVNDRSTWHFRSKDFPDSHPFTTSQQANNQDPRNQLSAAERLWSSYQQISAAVMGSSQFGTMCCRSAGKSPIRHKSKIGKESEVLL